MSKILDGVLIVNEIVGYAKTEDIKVDFEKAFDCINWALEVNGAIGFMNVLVRLLPPSS